MMIRRTTPSASTTRSAWRTRCSRRSRSPSSGTPSSRTSFSIRSYSPARRSEQEHALAGRLGVEQSIGLGRLIEGVAMGEQALDVDLAIGDEARALGLDHAREGPGADHSQLLPDHVAADVDRDAAALANQAHRAPGAGRADRGRARGLGAGAVEREVDALAVGER